MTSHRHTLPTNILGYEVHNPDPYRVYLLMRAIGAFAFSLIITYELVYHTTVINLNPIQLVMVGVVLESMTVLFEIPTGLVADRYSRRLSILIGIALLGFGFLVEGIIPTLAAVLLTQLLWGLGFTFYSGAADAWIADEVEEELANQAYLRGAQISQIMRLCGVAAGAFLVTFGLKWPIIIGALIEIILALFLTLKMTEMGFQPLTEESQQSLWGKMILPFKEAFLQLRIRPVLLIILSVGFVIGLSIGGFDRLNVAHIFENFQLPELGSLNPVAWFSIISGIVGILSIGGTEIVRRKLMTEDKNQISTILLSLYSGMTVFTLIFALSGRFYLAIAGFCISQALRNTGRPLLIIWINQNTTSAIRATTISLYWQSNAMGQIIGSPIIGWIGTLYTVRMALTVAGIIYSTVLPLLYFSSFQQSNKDEVLL